MQWGESAANSAARAIGWIYVPGFVLLIIASVP
ncbi:hypothetical protein SAMN05216596_102850 [Pseudomonas congelans]|uniref:Uncharacterized protein n=1 Tax=Pseudomonas congelans TaxID=200452 RepID=A0A1H0PVQ4_9PSED|nr:hypothetical protein [Pseudomonas sp. PvP007]MBP1145009.1 hypothetical protein [Pseudomonas sp. PvP027]MBP1196778.1 hypothetical protein [Pseudomonas sp. PvP100]SDP09173.1 hypothetical protein SAMN05216596_102850 [Pseudomonas congelans]